LLSLSWIETNLFSIKREVKAAIWRNRVEESQFFFSTYEDVKKRVPEFNERLKKEDFYELKDKEDPKF